jgi:excisionase family DNA binding protein
MNTEKSDILNLEQACELLQLSRSTIYKLLQAGKLPHRRAGRQYRFSKQALEDWVKAGEPGQDNKKPVTYPERDEG